MLKIWQVGGQVCSLPGQEGGVEVVGSMGIPICMCVSAEVSTQFVTLSPLLLCLERLMIYAPIVDVLCVS